MKLLIKNIFLVYSSIYFTLFYFFIKILLYSYNKIQITMKSHTLILTEAIFVGICLIAYYTLVRQITSYLKYNKLLINLFISGFLFHITFEYFGLNKAYSIDYVKNLV
jgi:hypothetical protein